jgi:hypothetical protein
MERGRALRGVLILVLALGLVLATTGSRQFDIKLVVKVTDCTTGNPIQGATVKVLTAATGSGSKYQATTDANGRAVINPLRIGDIEHTVQVSAPGYQTETKTKYMEAWSAVNMDICLQPDDPPPSETPTLTPTLDATFTPTSSATADESQVTRCGNHLSEQLKGLVAPEDSAVINQGADAAARCMLQCRSSTLNPLSEATAGPVATAERSIVPGGLGLRYEDFYACYQGCTDFGYFKDVAQAIVREGEPTGSIIITLVNLLGGPEGVQACDDAGAFAFQLVKQLAIQGALVNMVTVHSPVDVLVKDAKGRQAGFLENGQTIREIPDAQVTIAGESKYIIYPAIDEPTVILKSTGDGSMTLEMVRTKSGASTGGDEVQDIGFYDVPIRLGATGELKLTLSQPVLELNTEGIGTVSTPPSRFEATPVIDLATETLAPETATPEPATPTPEPGLLEKANWKNLGIGAVALCCVGVGGLMVVIVGIALYRRQKRKSAVSVAGPVESAAPGGIPCPRCGVFYQPGAQYCSKCGLHLVQPIPPSAPPAVCPNCGQPLRTSSKFCPRCGKPTGR